MLTQEDYWMIQELHTKGSTKATLPSASGVHTTTVRRALKRGRPPSRTRRRERYAKLKPYVATVDKLLRAGAFNAVVIFRELQALGYDGKIRVLRAYIFQALAAESTATKTVMIDSTHLKAHRTAASLLKKGGFRAASDAPGAG